MTALEKGQAVVCVTCALDGSANRKSSPGPVSPRNRSDRPQWTEETCGDKRRQSQCFIRRVWLMNDSSHTGVLIMSITRQDSECWILSVNSLLSLISSQLGTVFSHQQTCFILHIFSTHVLIIVPLCCRQNSIFLNHLFLERFGCFNQRPGHLSGATAWNIRSLSCLCTDNLLLYISESSRPKPPVAWVVSLNANKSKGFTTNDKAQAWNWTHVFQYKQYKNFNVSREHG